MHSLGAVSAELGTELEMAGVVISIVTAMVLATSAGMKPRRHRTGLTAPTAVLAMCVATLVLRLTTVSMLPRKRFGHRTWDPAPRGVTECGGGASAEAPHAIRAQSNTP
jgi:energy-converting hydrogenase Eha subunit A